MCGILGFNWNDRRLLKKMLKEITHRGPDGEGVYIDNISLGHKRLAIIDLSSSGKQPMSNESGDVWITFNGEIYNYNELKAQLREKHSFKSATDTEVLLHLYEECGIKMLEKLIGMFAFCIYDSRKKIFFLARDRVGIKPLYYHKKNREFIFCSEIKGILNHNIKRQVNHDAIPYFLAFRANTSSETMFKDIMKLEPGHFAVYHLKTHELEINSYWTLTSKQENFTEKYYSEQLFQLLKDSVRLRLISDVPYGAYLSGGVDSGTIVALMSLFTSQPIKTFSVGFREEEGDTELNASKFLSESIGTDHHELLIGRESIKLLPKIVYHCDEPMSDPTSIPIYLLSQYAKKYCTVILTGEGSDELFVGYPQYKFMKMHYKFVRHLPISLRKQIPKITRFVPKIILGKGFRFASALGKKGLERFSNFLISNNFSEQYLNLISLFNESETSEILNKKINFYEEYNKKYFSSNNLIAQCCLFDFKGNMVEDLLMKLDKNTMAFAIEGRVPFLDHRVAELAFTMPQELKLKGFKDKFILRKTFNKLVPAQTRKRKKRHFFVPIDAWLSEELSTLKESLLSKNYIEKQNIFNYNYIKKTQEGFKNSKLFYSRQLWSLINFQIWHKMFIEHEDIKI